MKQDPTSITRHDGDMRCCTEYSPSQTTFTTDVASSLGGRGEFPTPGDMLASCLASCMLSMIAYTGARKEFNTRGISIEAASSEGARGVGSICLDIHVPMPCPPDMRRILQAAAESCPVAASLHPEVEKKVTWHWAE